MRLRRWLLPVGSPLTFGLALLILWPLLELFAFYQVGSRVGLKLTLVWMLVTLVLGMWLLRHHSLRSWRAFQSQIRQRQVPTVAIADGVLSIVGAIGLMLPGFVTDGVGMLLLIPLIRRWVRRFLAWLIFPQWALAWGINPVRLFGTEHPAPRGGSAEVITGEVIDIDDEGMGGASGRPTDSNAGAASVGDPPQLGGQEHPGDSQ